MSEAKFNKAVSIVQNLPKDGPMQPTIDDKLYVRSIHRSHLLSDLQDLITAHRTVLPIL